MTRRRDVLAGLGASLALPSSALGFGSPTRVDMCELDLGSGTLSRPNAWKRLLYEVEGTTSVECEERNVRLPPDDPELFQHPFCILLGNDGFTQPNPAATEQLERYLQYGGFLLIDDVTASAKGPFDQAVRALVRRLFPTRQLGRLPTDHSVYRTFFLLKRPLGRLDRFDYLEGVTVGNVTPVIYCRNDLSGALDRGGDGRPVHSCVPGGEHQRREALKLGINLVMYSLTANYKKDQAHVRALMREGRLE
ncbi:MAG: DUF4159 domain-containing protein [Myxococcales bacterium]|nr:DUF4159 domain-containing protein [Myxococcales bacterium]